MIYLNKLWGLLKSNNKVIFILFLLIIIISSLTAIFYFSNTPNYVSKSASNLKGYDIIKPKVLELSTADNVVSQRAVTNLTILENNKASKSDQYKAISDIGVYFSILYGQTNDPKYKSIFPYLDKFAKENFGKLYDKADFYQICQDPTCADGPIPDEIAKIINDITLKSSYSEETKQQLISGLKDASYINKKEGEQMIYDTYYNVLQNLHYFENKSTNPTVDKQISAELEKFLESKYPKRLEESKKISPL